jgi:hypothetical protein
VLNAPEPKAFGYVPKLDYASHRLHVVSTIPFVELRFAETMPVTGVD